ncbi:hypothetical protein A0J61_02082 [Choanephora cucurbitarum]|uniref:Uncharacterized protein n=1 Tax=Choanephora cucurbitarum TaxID=101091 RepID=A0A1C7NM01_9FUNG|nr:hypothetical protein A0J61_02082 [Choanephora cucurbitarum]
MIFKTSAIYQVEAKLLSSTFSLSLTYDMLSAYYRLQKEKNFLPLAPASSSSTIQAIRLSAILALPP